MFCVGVAKTELMQMEFNVELLNLIYYLLLRANFIQFNYIWKVKKKMRKKNPPQKQNNVLSVVAVLLSCREIFSCWNQKGSALKSASMLVKVSSGLRATC